MLLTGFGTRLERQVVNLSDLRTENPENGMLVADGNTTCER